MDAIDFIKIKKRMCRTMDACNNCPFSDCVGEDIEIISVVEEWAKAHPVKTRQNEILRMFPNVDVNDAGVIDICPSCMDTNFDCAEGITCDVCKKDYWMKEIE